MATQHDRGIAKGRGMWYVAIQNKEYTRILKEQFSRYMISFFLVFIQKSAIEEFPSIFVENSIRTSQYYPFVISFKILLLLYLFGSYASNRFALSDHNFYQLLSRDAGLQKQFSFLQIAFSHLLENFKECWWDSILLDILICNGLGIHFGLYLCQKLEMRKYYWESIK